ncbi:MAG: hypothetical protein OXG08_04595 [Gammaproteobacteria bacterium]|nr:hypothetical protein [Gammaproteobacteria bacterium]
MNENTDNIQRLNKRIAFLESKIREFEAYKRNPKNLFSDAELAEIREFIFREFHVR